jgi:hypothetical protein
MSLIGKIVKQLDSGKLYVIMHVEICMPDSDRFGIPCAILAEYGETSGTQMVYVEDFLDHYSLVRPVYGENK